MVKTQRRPRAGAASSGQRTAKQAITLRLDQAQFRRLERLARAENRTPTNYVETAVLRDMAAKEEAARVITMFVAEDAAGLAPGSLVRTKGKSDERYTENLKPAARFQASPESSGKNSPHDPLDSAL